MSQGTAKLSRPKGTRWVERYGGQWVSSEGKYGILEVSGAFYAFQRNPYLAIGGPYDFLADAQAKVESHRWGFEP